MLYTEICNLPWLYIFVAVILVMVMVQCLVYMKRAWKHAQEIGLNNKQIKKGLTTGITISILPTIPVLLVFLTLMPLLGTPLPWLRLSVIGSATFESLAASIGVESVGETLSVGGYTINGWIAAAWVMTIGASTSIVWSTLAIKPISKLYGQAAKFDMRLVLALGAGCLMGTMAYATVSFGLSAISTKGVVFLTSFLVGAIVVVLTKKFPKQKWLSDFCMAIGMIVGMIVACLVF